MIPILPLLLKDFYKVDHLHQYPEGISLVYNNFTARMSRMAGMDRMMVFGIQYLIKEYLIRQMNEQFFRLPKDKAILPYKRTISNALKDPDLSFDHIEALWELGHLPLLIKALPEGSLVDLKVPFMTSVSTHPDFAWIVNMLETLESMCIWFPSTSATTAFHYRCMFEAFAKKTGAAKGFIPFQAHDFSARGMTSPESGCTSSAGHVLSFLGTDSIMAIPFLEYYYNADSDKELIGTSVYATEHAVMCMDGPEGEYALYRKLALKTYRDKIVSIVSDTYNLWRVVTEYLPKMKDELLQTKGKLVIRPDSGDPVLILCGDPAAPAGTPQHKGLIELLWETFGGSVNSLGFKVLDPHIGAIYGDSITPERAHRILTILMEKKFSTGCVVLGIGSYTYQYVTRDNFGTACKATYAEVNGEARELFKDPITDGGKAAKKSAKGLLKVIQDPVTKRYQLLEQVTKEQEKEGCLIPVFANGELLVDHSLKEIRARVEGHVSDFLATI